MASTPPTSADTEPLRILHIASGDLWAGAEAQIFQLVSALNDRPDVAVRVVVMNAGILADRLRERGVQVDVLDERSESTTRLARRVRLIAREWRPAVIHTHRRKEHILGGLATLASGARAVATIHGRSEFSHPWWKIRQSLLAGMEQRVLAHIHRRIIAVSAEMASHLPGPQNRIKIIQNGIDVQATRVAAGKQHPVLPGTPGGRIAFIGRLEPVKRVERIVEALAQLQQETPDRWSLFIIGEGSRRAAIEARIQAHGVGDRVHMLGFLPEPLPWLAQMDALVFASEHEGLPMTALEALALGVAVVTPAVGGLTDLVQESRLGRLAESDDPDAIAAAIQSVGHGQPAGSQQNDASVPSSYTVSHSVDSHLLVYREIAAAGS
jgi:L-malate glycosyltransferase